MGMLASNEKYLGNPLFPSRGQIANFTFLRDKVYQRLEGWKARCLPWAGRTTLTNAVALNQSIYLMSTFKVPLQICEDLNKAVRKFWWTGTYPFWNGMHFASQRAGAASVSDCFRIFGQTS